MNIKSVNQILSMVSSGITIGGAISFGVYTLIQRRISSKRNDFLEMLEEKNQDVADKVDGGAVSIELKLHEHLSEMVNTIRDEDDEDTDYDEIRSQIATVVAFYIELPSFEAFRASVQDDCKKYGLAYNLDTNIPDMRSYYEGIGFDIESLIELAQAP